jgi:hypothetical protein
LVTVREPGRAAVWRAGDLIGYAKRFKVGQELIFAAAAPRVKIHVSKRPTVRVLNTKAAWNLNHLPRRREGTRGANRAKIICAPLHLSPTIHDRPLARPRFHRPDQPFYIPAAFRSSKKRTEMAASWRALGRNVQTRATTWRRLGNQGRVMHIVQCMEIRCSYECVVNNDQIQFRWPVSRARLHRSFCYSAAE